ncbi:glycoside hydrolase family 3 N-terminal domain-containing protein [Consotaella aegiceratis]|uniref:glycoside hydrolase family 3 N-terminal domain-containing protein n=1 Tax=Consotaella aegiceratis TaxID=3097961 RepID=UPI002F3F55CC
MTLDEKLGQMRSIWLILDENGRHTVRKFEASKPADADMLKQLLSTGMGHVSRSIGTLNVEASQGVRALNSLQKFFVEETRLGIPAISHEECLSGLMIKGATLFPSAIAYGSTWNPDLIEAIGAEIGDEARAVGCRQALAPVLDVIRDPRWGRTEESFGEDPYLVGVMGARYVRGLQGHDRAVLATLKHFAGHSASEGGRNHAPVHMGWRELNDTFLLPFEMAVRLADAGSVMPAYHDIDGEPCHSSSRLLTEVLREAWGFDGIIVADYGGVGQLHQHHRVAADRAQAAVLAYNAGLDIELPNDECVRDLPAALAAGSITLDTIDEIVHRILTEKVRLGLFEKPYADDGAIVLQAPQTIELARTAAEQSIVILDNNGILPLAGGSKVAVIGPTADDPMALLGGYSFPVHLIFNEVAEAASSVVTLLDGLKAALGDEQVIHSRGCNILDRRSAGIPLFPGDVDDSAGLDQPSTLSTRLDMIPHAVATAKAADVAIVCVGDLSGVFRTGTVGEGSDVDSLALPGVQQELLEAIVATGTPVVVVLTSGRPYNLGGLEEKLAAQVVAFLGGQEGGNGLAAVLSGAVEPSGRLPLSFPQSAGALPYYYNHKFKSPGSPIARHFGSRYPFGHGLAYTRFEFSDLALVENQVPVQSGDVRLSFVIRNVGSRTGVAVPQLYVRDDLASIVRPVKELKAFARVQLRPGTARRVVFSVPTDMLNFTGADGTRMVEPGLFTLMVGASSGDVRLRASVELTGEPRRLGRDWRMESDVAISDVAT